MLPPSFERLFPPTNEAQRLAHQEVAEASDKGCRRAFVLLNRPGRGPDHTGGAAACPACTVDKVESSRWTAIRYARLH